MFLAFQYPVEIPGITNSYFLRAAVNEIRKPRGWSRAGRHGLRRAAEGEDGADQRGRGGFLAERFVNEGFSGGEKKRNEILQMAVLEPRLAVLDETDSGLDIDALRIVAKGVNKLRSEDRAFIVVTHYQRLLDYIVPDFVHVLYKGRIVKVRRQGTGAGAGRKGLRLASRRRRGRGLSGSHGAHDV